ncbi:MAG: acyltransferase [Verrucomicrobiota bacterium]
MFEPPAGQVHHGAGSIPNGKVGDPAVLRAAAGTQQPRGYLESKNHYELLDGLRGVAAVMVVAFHLLEPHSGGNRFAQIINHGYLAVDFFFVLSGFVVAYAYDDRWGKMTLWDFCKRRLIRLQPMVIAGSIVGAALFYLQASSVFPSVALTPLWKMLGVMLIGFTLIPLPSAMDIRGWQEMHPLNGPAWSLFFEYVANLLYAIVVRRFSKPLLSLLVAGSACLLIHYATMGPQGDVIGGWSLDGPQLRIGFIRLLYPFFAGMLLCRLGITIPMKRAFWVCSLLLIAALSAPRFGGDSHLWINGLYESFCIIVLFPLIVAIGAGGSMKGSGISVGVCRLLGGISYPLYITHFPWIYVYTAWVNNRKISLSTGLFEGLLVLVLSVALAYGYLKLYDEPVRRWLTKRFLVKKALES